MSERFDESVHPLAHAGRMLVRCPACHGPALAVRKDRRSRVTCTGCGFAKDWATKGDGTPRDDVVPVEDAVTDPVSGLALWLQAPCVGHTVWALDGEHLDFLRRAIAATLRERATYDGWDGRPRTDTYYGRIPAALPTWMKLAKHRDEVLAALEKMARTLP